MMWVEGHIKCKSMAILINSGSTGNFLDSNMAKRILCPIEHATGFEIKVVDWRSLTSQGKYLNVNVFIQGYEFITDLFLLPLDVCDLVLWGSTIEQNLQKDAMNEDQVIEGAPEGDFMEPIKIVSWRINQYMLHLFFILW